MPRFFFDVIDQGIIDVDDEGLDLPDLSAAVNEAKRAMSEMTLEARPGKATASLVIQVRDGPDTPVVTVTATVATEPSVTIHPRVAER
jgi:hypothetical protein